MKASANHSAVLYFRTALCTLLCAVLLVLAGCGGGGSDDDEDGGPEPPDPVETGPAAIEGVWTGTAVNPAEGTVRAAWVVGNRAGDAILTVQAGVDSIVVRGDACCDNNIDGEADGWTLINQHKVVAPVNLMITDMINDQKALTGDVTVEGVRYDIDLRRDAEFQAPLTLADLAGTYQITSSRGTWTNFIVSDTGAISGSDSVDCQFAGQVRIPDPAHNMFEITSFSMSACTGGGSIRNGSYSGMGYLKGQASNAFPKYLSFVLTGPLIYPTAIPGAAAITPGVTLGAEPSSPEYGGTTTLTWSAQALTNCTASGDWSGAQPDSGTFTTGALTQSASYTLTCGDAGITKAATATVTVAALPADPGEAGKATLIGVDANDNGVRDDQERRLLTTYSPGPVRTLLIERSVQLNEALAARSEEATAGEVFTKLFQNMECLYAQDREHARQLAIETTAYFMNTPERANAYIDFSQAAGGTVVDTRVPEQIEAECP